MEGTPPTQSKFNSISMMSQFRDVKCVEELRVEDMARASGAAPGGAAPGAASWGATGAGFGAPASSAASVPGFGQTQASPPLGFGGLGAAPTVNPASAPTLGTSGFGAFGQSSPALPAAGGFGGFSAPSALTLPGSTQSSGGFGGFGAAAAAPTPGFGAPATGGLGSTGSQFGQPQTQGTYGVGAAPQPQTLLQSPQQAAPATFYQVKLEGGLPSLVPFIGFSLPSGMTQTSPEMAEYKKLAEKAYEAAQEAGKAEQLASSRSDYGGIAFGLLLVAKDEQMCVDQFMRDFERRQAKGAANAAPTPPAGSPGARCGNLRNSQLLTLNPGALRVDLTPRRRANMDSRRSLRGLPAVSPSSNVRPSPDSSAVGSLRSRSGRHSMRSTLYSIGNGQEKRYKAENEQEEARSERRARPFLVPAKPSEFYIDPNPQEEAAHLPAVDMDRMQSPASWAASTPSRFAKAAASRTEDRSSSSVRRGRPASGSKFDVDNGIGGASRSSSLGGVDTVTDGANREPGAIGNDASAALRPNGAGLGASKGGSADTETEARSVANKSRAYRQSRSLPFDEDDPLDYLPVMTAEGYYMSPSIAELSRLTCHELTMIEDFTIGREGHGEVRWLEPVDVRGVVVDEAVCIESSAVEVNPGKGRAEMLGDVPASVSLQFGEGADVDHIKQLCEQNKTKFVSYDPESGILKLVISFF